VDTPGSSIEVDAATDAGTTPADSTTAAASAEEPAPRKTPARKPAAQKTAAAEGTAGQKAPAKRTSTPRTTTPRTTTPRTTAAKPTSAGPASEKVAESGASTAPKTAARRKPASRANPGVTTVASAKAAKAATDESLALLGADPVVATEPTAAEPDVVAAPDPVEPVVVAQQPAVEPDVVAEATAAEPDVVAERPAPAKAPVKRAPRAPRAPRATPARTAPVEEAPPLVEAPAETSVDVAVEPLVEEAPAETSVEPMIEEPTVVEPTADEAGEAPAAEAPVATEVVLRVSGLTKRFGDTTAVAGIDLEIAAGSFFGIVGPNGAGKTTTLSMVTGLLRPDAGTVTVHGADVWKNPVVAKRTMGVLPDRLRLFDRLTGAQLLYYSGILHGLEKAVVRSRTSDLAAAFGLEDSLDRLVTDYSAGMTKKIALAAAMIHSPRLLVLDEPFESVDPVSAANVIEILQKYVAAGGTVVMSSHTMNLIERICDSVAVVVNGAVLASGTMSEVRRGMSLEDRFVELAGGRKAAEGMEWLHRFSD
jgi:ABC-type multidrug transport system ATPase subunit